MSGTTFEELERELAAARRLLDSAARRAFALWQDEVANDFRRSYVEPFDTALEAYERAVRDVVAAVEIIDRLED